MQSGWDLGKGYEGSEEQMMWWIEMLLREEDDDEDTAEEGFELTVIPVFNKIRNRYVSEADERFKAGALEAGLWSDLLRRCDEGDGCRNCSYLFQLARQEKLRKC
tara:strand:- start:121 stop:435 length:315 start_codon:yes stop_codon:yes gene_type:complete